MHLTDTMQRYIVHWGEMGSRWGMNRSVAQIHALLYPGREAAECRRDRRDARNRAIQRQHRPQGTAQLGAGADHARARRPPRLLHAQHDTWEVIRVIMEGRKRREMDPTLAALRECAAQLKTDRETPAAVRERIVTQLEFLETVTRWYDSVKRLPRKTLLKMMRMGERIAKVIGDYGRT